MSEERLERVERFEDLRATDYVVVRGCRVCWAGECRGILLKLLRVQGDVGWEMVPNCSKTFLFSGVAEDAVRDGRVFKVIIPPSSETREVAQPKKLERQGVR